MRLSKIDLEEKKLDNLFKSVSTLPEDEIKSHLAKYLCVQASGFLETVIKELVAEYHQSTCKKETANYINNKISSFTNINDKKLQLFLQSFNIEWLESYLGVVSEEQIESLNSIISNRHLIAHGQGTNCNLSYRNIVKYYTDLKDVVVVLKLIIKK